MSIQGPLKILVQRNHFLCNISPAQSLTVQHEYKEGDAWKLSSNKLQLACRIHKLCICGFNQPRIKNIFLKFPTSSSLIISAALQSALCSTAGSGLLCCPLHLLHHLTQQMLWRLSTREQQTAHYSGRLPQGLKARNLQIQYHFIETQPFMFCYPHRVLEPQPPWIRRVHCTRRQALFCCYVHLIW